jgi:hypothetical protein
MPLGPGEPPEVSSRPRSPRSLRRLPSHPLSYCRFHHSPYRVDVLWAMVDVPPGDVAVMDGPGFGTTTATSMGFTASGEPRHPMTSSPQAATAGRRRRKRSLGPYPASAVYRGAGQ